MLNLNRAPISKKKKKAMQFFFLNIGPTFCSQADQNGGKYPKAT